MRVEVQDLERLALFGSLFSARLSRLALFGSPFSARPSRLALLGSPFSARPSRLAFPGLALWRLASPRGLDRDAAVRQPSEPTSATVTTLERVPYSRCRSFQRLVSHTPRLP